MACAGQLTAKLGGWDAQGSTWATAALARQFVGGDKCKHGGMPLVMAWSPPCGSPETPCVQMQVNNINTGDFRPGCVG
eukprot:278128-Chlamydomonas_euryale.AAC.3